LSGNKRRFGELLVTLPVGRGQSLGFPREKLKFKALYN
jgi:hypothetical protein